MSEHFNVPMKILEKSHGLPPEYIFQNAQGVVFSHLGVKIKRKIFNSKSLKSLHVYLVINNGYIFVYIRNGWGYALDLKEMQGFGYKKYAKEGSQFHAQITLCFKYGELKLEFDDAKVYMQWWNLLNAFINPKINRKDLQVYARKFAPGAFSKHLEFVVTAEYMDEQDKTQRVSVLRYPANTVNLNETVFDQTYLESPTHAEEEEEEFDSEPSPVIHRTPANRQQQQQLSHGRSPSGKRKWFGASFANPPQDQKESTDDEEVILAQRPAPTAYPLPSRTVQRRKWGDLRVEEERPPLLSQILSRVTPPWERETFEDELQQEASLISYFAPTPHSNAHGGPSPLRYESFRGSPRVSDFEDDNEDLSSTTSESNSQTPPPSQRRTPSSRRVTPASSVKAQYKQAKTPVSRPRRQAEAPTPRSSDRLKSKKKANYKE